MEVKISDLLDGIEDGSVDIRAERVSTEHIKELTRMKLNAEQQGRTRRLSRRILALALAAALVLALGVTAYAVNATISSPQAAEKVAREQLEVWKELGLISQDMVFDGPADQIVENEERNGGDYWYGRIFRHRYDVRWYVGWDGSSKYGCSLGVDTLSGKITMACFFALPDENDEPVGETPVYAPDGNVEDYWYFYDNFDDIFPADMTVDRLCTLLADYWGFGGYRLEMTGDRYDMRKDSYDQTHLQPIDGSTLLLNLPKGNGNYLAIYFDGDQEGAPMYLEMDQFAGHVGVLVGTGHAVG